MSETLDNLLNRLIGATIMEAQSAYPMLEPEVVEEVVLQIMRRDLQSLKEGDSAEVIAANALTEITKVLDSKLN